jgi:hypothetical protein
MLLVQAPKFVEVAVAGRLYVCARVLYFLLFPKLFPDQRSNSTVQLLISSTTINYAANSFVLYRCEIFLCFAAVCAFLCGENGTASLTL